MCRIAKGKHLQEVKPLSCSSARFWSRSAALPVKPRELHKGKQGLHVMSVSLSVSCSGARGSFMLDEGCHSLLPWFSSASPLSGTYMWRSWISLYLHIVLCPAHLSGPVLTFVLWKDKIRAVSSNSFPEKWERSSHKALVFARDTWEAMKGSCLLFLCRFTSIKVLARPGTTVLPGRTLQANISFGPEGWQVGLWAKMKCQRNLPLTKII